MARERIGQVLHHQGLISEQHVAAALAYQRRWGGKLGGALRRLGLLAEEDLLRALSQQLGVPVVHVGDMAIEPDVLSLLPPKLIQRHRVLPLSATSARGAARLVVAFAEPQDLLLVDEIAFAAGMIVEPVLAGEEDLDQAIARHLGPGVPRDAAPRPPGTGPAHTGDGRHV